MKALAFIAALFLPGTYIATLFGMSMFDWKGDSGSSMSATSSSSSQPRTVMPSIWIYWVVSVVLTFVVITGWRIWWVKQDRAFRKRLPKVVRGSRPDEGPIETNAASERALTKNFWEEVFEVRKPKRPLTLLQRKKAKNSIRQASNNIEPNQQV
jgi:hypothetical protein